MLTLENIQFNVQLTGKEVIAKGVFESAIRAIFPFDGRDKYLTLSKKSK